MSTIRRLAAAAAMFATLAAGLPAGAGVTQQGDFRVEYKGKDIGPYTNLDTIVENWMSTYDIHAAQLAVRSKGKLIFSHAYTKGSAYSTVTTTNVFRLASISKMVETAAFTKLVSEGKLTGKERVFSYLGINAPLLASQKPDKRINKITVNELVAHTSGLPGSGDGDPLFQMRDIELKLGSEPLTESQFAQYLYGVPLNSDPGATSVYSNVGYFLLSQVIARAANMSYVDYVQSEIIQPLGMTNWTLSPTSHKKVDRNEVFADAPYTGPSVFDLSTQPAQAPFNFEGGNIMWEVTAGPTDFVTNAESVSKFINTWNVYGTGGRAVDYARDGCIPGASTWAESRSANVDFALLFNKQPCLDFSYSVISQLRSAVGGL
jgi:CubicO group peptidase (beta-lactamase class C family)